jgi:hypothetical protein
LIYNIEQKYWTQPQDSIVYEQGFDFSQLKARRQPVPPPVHNVVLLNVQRRPSQVAHVPTECLGLAVRKLDDLRCCVEQVIYDPRWSALQWRSECTPLMLRLAGARLSLEDLADITVDEWPDTNWAIRLHAAREEVERRLTEVSTSLSALSSEETSNVEALISFNVDGAGLRRAAGELRSLIATRYPETAGVR